MECALSDIEDLEARLKAALSDSYDIQRELGAGGMAIVFLAHDIKHDREVALKVFRPELASSMGGERFLREIHIAAKLSHPHILPLYDSGTADGFLYYVMPLVEGESLGDRIEREQQLPFDDALQITGEVADALNYAHSRGLVHRDIKPDNIMLSGGHAVVMDFGIARAVSAAGGDKLTQTGMAVGTPAYMSPEQAMGEEVDGRADIYSLGCVLYEMLVGQIPFTGPTPQAVMARHSMEAVPRPQIVRDTIPDDLEDIILCALNKVPADRFRTAGEFAEALKAVSAEATFVSGGSRVTRVRPRVRKRRPQLLTVGLVSAGVLGLGLLAYQLGTGARGSGSRGDAPGLDSRSVAVLYFEDLSSDGELGYFADGLTEGLINKLAQVRALQVISRNGVAPYRDGAVSRDSIARALSVGTLVAGSVEPVGDRVRVTARLVDGASGADIDRMSLELPAADLLAVQDSAAQEVSRILREQLGEEIRLRDSREGTASGDAWSLALRGERARKEGEALRRSPGALTALELADSLLERAEAADNQWAKPTLSRGWIAYRRAQLESAHEAVPWIEAGLSLAERALELGTSDAEALELRGALRYRLWRLEVTSDPTAQADLLNGAQADLEAAVELQPALASAYSRLSDLHYQRQDNFSALIAARRAYEEDAYLSTAARNLYRLFWVHYDLARFTDSQRWCDVASRRFPADYRFVECQLFMLIAPPSDPDVERAWRLSSALDTLAPVERAHIGRLVVGGVISRADMADSANAVLDNVIATARADPEMDREGEIELSGYEAIMRTLLGQHDEAIDLLIPYVAINPEHSFEIEGDLMWWWRPLRDHPRFREVGASRS